jgi:hypothetical protein
MSCGTVDDSAIPPNPRGVEKVAVERTELVAALVPLGRNPPVLGQLGAVEQPENRRRISDVYRQQHGAIITVTRSCSAATQASA